MYPDASDMNLEGHGTLDLHDLGTGHNLIHLRGKDLELREERKANCRVEARNSSTEPYGALVMPH